ncbi:alpha/beta fold hydrolase [Catellatospora tritici]|uniref:alpha/beta fold hydrolase n=1 Tax=Catellatospora tritici TaxID=2851566 RepID=UPI001C2D4067|nr:alpha/beta hydrolase [Catellatospora tritici]MBV1850837.1 alpha/beta hydrolase [Catellatospora tritici]MBV1851090.1 alpha/beta hydrolase [Catellatospora tritici]
MRSAYADLGGPVHHVDFGGPADAPPVVLVHGLGGSHLNWTRLAAQLTPYARVHALDLPGFGRTPAAGRPTTVTANAHVLRHYLSDVIGGPAVLIGNSMGGMISTLTAADTPDLARAVVLVDPSVPIAKDARIDPAVRRQFLINLIPGVASWSMRRRLATVPARTRVLDTLAVTCADPGRIPDQVIADAVALDAQLPPPGPRSAAYLAASRSLLRLLAAPTAYWRAMASLTMPVLLAHGLHDRLVPVASARATAARLPHWTYVELDSGHVPQLEHPTELAAHILPWLRRHDLLPAA